MAAGALRFDVEVIDSKVGVSLLVKNDRMIFILLATLALPRSTAANRRLHDGILLQGTQGTEV